PRNIARVRRTRMFVATKVNILASLSGLNVIRACGSRLYASSRVTQQRCDERRLVIALSPSVRPLLELIQWTTQGARHVRRKSAARHDSHLQRLASRSRAPHAHE